MEELENIPKKRIEVIDGLRGFALLGILLLHTVEHFSFIGDAKLNPEIFKSIDPYVSTTIEFLFKGKAFAIFSLLFGFSFFIQMDRSERKGEDFRLRFVWRLLILLVFGYVFSAILLGEILTIYALIGLPLVFIYHLRTRTLVILSVLILLQLPWLVYMLIANVITELQIDGSQIGALFGEAFYTFEHGSIEEVIKFNFWKGHLAIWLWAFVQGKLLQTFGLFVLGLAAGKSHFFEKITTDQKMIIKWLIISCILCLVFNILLILIPFLGLNDTNFFLLDSILKVYSALSLASILGIGFIFIYKKQKYGSLHFYGRMSLTNYVVQPLIGVPLFYGFGLGLHLYCGPTLSLLIGVIILIVQIYFSIIWLNRYYYGPLEWFWRISTFLNWKIKFRRQSKKLEYR